MTNKRNCASFIALNFSSFNTTSSQPILSSIPYSSLLSFPPPPFILLITLSFSSLYFFPPSSFSLPPLSLSLTPPLYKILTAPLTLTPQPLSPSKLLTVPRSHPSISFPHSKLLTAQLVPFCESSSSVERLFWSEDVAPWRRPDAVS